MLRNIRPGAYVEFTSNDGEDLSGEVLFSDDVQKYFVFQRSSKNDRHDTFDVYLFPHNNVKDLRITKPGNNNQFFPELDLQKLTKRCLTTEKTEQERLKIFEADVPKDARELFEHLFKTLPAECNLPDLPGRLPVRWEKADLHVLEQTVIKPPYAVENVLEKNNTPKAKTESDYVRKLVEKFYSERNHHT
ncbi:hypothetical protein Aperf_G00000068479 [Anoplocephala perfoliata]